jgi:hypothetical protein
MSDGELMNEIINLLAEKERWVQAIKGLLTFGVFKFIVVIHPYPFQFSGIVGLIVFFFFFFFKFSLVVLSVIAIYFTITIFSLYL